MSKENHWTLHHRGLNNTVEVVKKRKLMIHKGRQKPSSAKKEGR